MHDSMLYKINVNMEFKQDTSDFVSDSDAISEIDNFNPPLSLQKI